MRTGQFWGLVFVVWFAFSIPYVRMPFLFLATWAHEWGHGIGAQISGGTFESFIVNSDFSGLAYSRISSKTQQVVSLLMGLLGPSLMGGALLVLTRLSERGRLVLALLTLGLGLTALIWAGNWFTRGWLLAFAGFFGLIAWKAPREFSFYTALMVSIAICLNAVTMIDYFFVQGGNVGGQVYQSDVAKLTQLLGGFQIMWALLLTALSFFILYWAFRISSSRDSPQTSTTD